MCDDIGQRLSLGVVVAERRRSVPSTNSVSHSRKVTGVGIETDRRKGVLRWSQRAEERKRERMNKTKRKNPFEQEHTLHDTRVY